MRHGGRIVWLLAVSALTFVGLQGVGCGQDNPLPSLGPGVGGGGGGGAAGSGAGGLFQGACFPEGKTAACYVELGRSGDLVNCFSGTQVCKDGKWGPCGGESGTLSTVLATPENQTGLFSPMATFGPDAGGCAANPCNPYCIGTDETTPVDVPDGGTQVYITGTVQDITEFPTAKQNSNADPCTPGSPPADLMLCSYDYCCSNTTHTCVQWIESTLSVQCTVPTGVDYTTGIGCQNGSGKTHIPVCNRGNADAPNTGKLAIMGYPANPNKVGTGASPTVCQNSSPTPPEGCIIDLSKVNLKAGKCLDIDVEKAALGQVAAVKCNSTNDFYTGNRTTMVNPPPTTTLPAGLKAANGGTQTYTQLDEIDKCNNFSFVYTQTGSCAQYAWQPPPPTTVSFTYVATCSAGDHPRWNLFAYDVTVPNASDVAFSVSTAPIEDGGATGTFTTPVMVAHPANPLISDPAVCPMNGGVAGCPKDLYAALGGIPAAQNAVLQLDMLLTSTTAIPTVNSWQLSYSCVPAE